MGQRLRVDDGTELLTMTTGQGPPLVLCHGGPGWVDYLGPAAAMVDDLTTIHRYDQRGIGPHTVARYVADLEELRVYCGHQRWAVGGHSWGATLALCYALEHPDRVTGVCYMNGTGLGLAWRQAHNREQERRLNLKERERFAQLDATARTPAQDREFRILSVTTDFADRARARTLATTLVDALPTPNYEANAALVAELKTWDEDELAQRCRSLDLPVLVIHGDEDPRPRWALDTLIASLPQVEIAALRAVGHFPWLDDSVVFRTALRAGIARLLGAE